jgi:N-acetylglucosamine kinase-like BadF-type ATPase
MTALYLAIDGGNSKTDVVLGDEAGRVLGFVRGGTSSPHVVGLGGTVEVLGSLVRSVHAEAGLPVGTPIEVLSVYLAGADLPIEVSRLHDAVAGPGWGRRTIVTVVAGAGTNCVGRAADGRTARFLALGPIAGDWGGGHDLAEYALRYAARGEDGRGRPTALSAAVAAYFGRPTVEAVSIALHFGEIEMDRIHELAPLLFEVAATGDEVAYGLIERQAEEVLAQHRVAAERLGLLDKPHALVLGGGVLRARHRQLEELIVAGARAIAPQVVVSVVDVPPVAGAALLALDALGSSAEAALRAAIADRPPTLLDPHTDTTSLDALAD